MYIYIVSTANELMNYFKENRNNMLNIYKKIQTSFWIKLQWNLFVTTSTQTDL